MASKQKILITGGAGDKGFILVASNVIGRDKELEAARHADPRNLFYAAASPATARGFQSKQGRSCKLQKSPATEGSHAAVFSQCF